MSGYIWHANKLLLDTLEQETRTKVVGASTFEKKKVELANTRPTILHNMTPHIPPTQQGNSSSQAFWDEIKKQQSTDQALRVTHCPNFDIFFVLKTRTTKTRPKRKENPSFKDKHPKITKGKVSSKIQCFQAP